MLRRLRPCAVLPTMRSLAWLDEWQIWMLFSSRVTNHKRHAYARRVRVWTICGACTPPSTAQVQHTVPHTSSSQVGEEFFRRIARSSKFARSHSLCNFSVNRYRLLRLYHVTDVRSYKRKQSVAQGVRSPRASSRTRARSDSLVSLPSAAGGAP